MDQERFDTFAKHLAGGQTRRGVLKGLAGTALGGVLAAVGLGEAAAKGGKVSICHHNDLGTYDYITVSQASLATHQAHGDTVTNLTDLANCGACGNACTAPANASATCISGSCGFTCDQGYEPNEAGNACVSICISDCPPFNCDLGLIDRCGGLCPIAGTCSECHDPSCDPNSD